MGEILTNEAVGEDRFTRSRILFGEGFRALQRTRVILFGVGGVGSFVLDCLYRSGIGEITIVDSDSFEVTNQNRQIGSECVGEPKVEVLARKYPGVIAIKARVNEEFLRTHDILSYDYIIDAIDDIPAKVSIARIASQKPYGRYIVSTGSAKKLDPTRIEVANVWKSYGDKFARKFRENLKKFTRTAKIKVVFSPEEPKCKALGSFSAVTGSFGLVIASEVVRNILQGESYAHK
ncbi:ThiF family adenylyltransferase [uncultured Helicobacter sp.]|uniref:ThiF family adenylyltransferase n=1 Tax=uncultured Helicobacter sp. TaxID=175537 RepID=UPI00374F16C0